MLNECRLERTFHPSDICTVNRESIIRILQTNSINLKTFILIKIYVKYVRVMCICTNRNIIHSRYDTFFKRNKIYLRNNFYSIKLFSILHNRNDTNNDTTMLLKIT